ncbi:MAG TPA: AmmeMemoRadiSam system protein B [Thermoanaerobaculia bacterium]|nr:AmmeMemoRadiSam system protein B [Thermoanaerobaculia bacterium]
MRPPAVAGLFYDADPVSLEKTVRQCLSPEPQETLSENEWSAVLLPHAGHVYSGRIAGAAIARLSWPSTVLLIGPNHRGTGARVALSPASAWRTPLGDVPAALELRDELLAASDAIQEDSRAHAEEHSLEVIVPFLQVVSPGSRALFLSIAEPDLPLCLSVGRAVAKAVASAASRGERVALVVSSDLNHYLPREANRKKDDRAVDALLRGDPEELFDRILVEERISMCGVLPATAALEALRRLPPTVPEVVAHGDSGDASGETGRVVGYASIIWKTEKAKEGS